MVRLFQESGKVMKFWTTATISKQRRGEMHATY